MKRLVTVLAIGAWMQAIALPVLAQEAAVTRPARQRPTSAPAGDFAKAEMARLEKIIKDLNLTADQQKKVEQIVETQRQANVNWFKEHGDDLKALRAKIEEAKAAKDAAKVKEVTADLAKLSASRKDLRDCLMKQLSDVLTKEQMDKLRAAMAPKRPDGPFEKLNLTPDQRQQAAKIMEAARAEAAKATDEATKAKIMKDAIEKARTTVLTEEQRKKLAEQAAGEGESTFAAVKELRDQLNLTDDQKSKIEEIVKDAKQKMAGVEGPERRKVLVDAWKKIQDLLTPEQKAQWEKWRKEHRGEGLGAKVRDGVRKAREGTTTQAAN